MLSGVHKLSTFLGTAVLAMGGSGCMTAAPLGTPSGQPEVLIRGANKAQTMKAVTEIVVGFGFRLQQQNERVAIFTRPCTEFEYKLATRAKWGTTPDYRVTCVLLDQPKGIRIVADVEVVANAGTDAQRTKNISKSSDVAHDVQDALELVVAKVALDRHAQQYPPVARDDEAKPQVWTGD